MGARSLFSTQRKQEKKKEKRERTNHYQKVNEISLESELIVKVRD
jgi:hypothetical protein